MHQSSCGLHEEAREHYRLHHCGACKAIGHQYSQPARIFLNFDCVFLAELLTALSGENTGAWHESYHSYVCFVPKDREEAPPLPLRYAAAANVLLAALKTDDNLKDAPSLLWRTVGRFFRPDFQKAEQEMSAFGLDMEEIWRWIECQRIREQEAGSRELAWYAEPTARITAAVFSRGAALAGAQEGPMYEFGFRLGKLVYVLDALEDWDKDLRKKQFNALRAAGESRQAAAGKLFGLSRQLQAIMQELPILPATREEYRQRLSANLAVRVTNSLEGKKAGAGKTIRERLAIRVLNARAFARQVVKQKSGWAVQPQYAMAFFAVFILPDTAKEVVVQPGQGIAMTALMAGLLSALFLRRRIRKAYRMVKKEIRRKKRVRKGGPDWEECLETFGGKLLLVLGGILTAILILLLGNCLKCDEDDTLYCAGIVCEGCCTSACDG
jgi:hypothetical protein